MPGIREFSADVIIVGSGPGGATVARELCKHDQKVLILERGYDHRKRFYYGTYLGALRYSDRMSLLFTEEGLNIIAPIMVAFFTDFFVSQRAGMASILILLLSGLALMFWVREERSASSA